MTTDLPVSHAANELLPWGLALGELDTRLSGVVQELIVPDPEGSIPGFPVCPSLEGRCGHVVCLN